MPKPTTRRGRLWLWIALVLALGAAPAHALAPPEPEQNLCARAFRASFDLILLRPMGVISTLFGSAVYAVLLPVTWPLDGAPAGAVTPRWFVAGVSSPTRPPASVPITNPPNPTRPPPRRPWACSCRCAKARSPATWTPCSR